MNADMPQASQLPPVDKCSTCSQSPGGRCLIVREYDAKYDFKGAK